MSPIFRISRRRAGAHRVGEGARGAHIFDLAGGGFESTVRLAKSAPRTWVPILLRNKYNVLDVLREHIHQLQIMRRMIERDDAEGLTAAMQRANAIQKILP